MIRFIKQTDINDVYNIYIPYVLNTSFTFEVTPPTYLEFKERVEGIIENYPYLVYELDGKIVGYAYATRFRVRKAYDASCELSLYVDPKYHNMHIGSKLIKELISELKKQNIVTVVSCISSRNINSIKFHEYMGFNKSGIIPNCGMKFKELHDLIIFSKQINNSIAEFIPYSKLIENYHGKDI